MALGALLLSVLLALGAGGRDEAAKMRAISELDAHATAGDWSAALASARRWLMNHPSDPDMRYNAGCALCRLGDPRAAAAEIVESIEDGFRDFAFMETDPDLAALRSHEGWRAVGAARDAAIAAAAKASGLPANTTSIIAAESLARWRKEHTGPRYETAQDDGRRILYAFDLDETSAAEMKRMLGEESDFLARHLFGQAQPDWVLVAIANGRDARRSFAGPGNTGVYDHSTRSLLTRDTGASLRHEFAHALHFGHMQRLGQRHPIWILEGLASLFEDYELSGDRLRVIPNQRHNLARKQALRNRHVPWARMAAMEHEAFMASPTQHYPQVRSMFEFLAAEERLQDFYRTYTQTWSEDPTGVAALERTFGLPIARIEDRWVAWIRARAPVDDVVEPGDGALGIVPQDATDGAKVLRLVRGGAADRAGLRAGDVIVEVDGRAVRSMLELIEAIARRDAGDAVSIRFRRDQSYSTVTATLLPLGAAEGRTAP